MDKKELETKRDENTINDIAEKLELLVNTNMITKEELFMKFVSKDVLINKMITVAGQMFIEYEKELDISNQIIKGCEDYIGDNNFKKHILDKVCGDNTKKCAMRKMKFTKKILSKDLIKF